MSDDVIERVAREMQSLSLTSWEMIEKDSQAAYLLMARVAIAAMREPTLAMTNNGWESWWDNQEMVLAWQAMIDAALGEHQ